MLLTLLLLASLGLDTLAVSLGLGVSGLPRRRWLGVGLTFAACEGGTPIAGLLCGHRVSAHLGHWSAWIAGILLLVVGLHQLRGSLTRPNAQDDHASAATQARAHGWRLLFLGLSVSIDNLAVGFTIGTLGLKVPLVLAAIAIQAFVLTALGLLCGGWIGRRWGRGAAIAAGVVLCLMAVSLLLRQALGH